jgi:membrane protein YqaA with SNARE-associated domain
LDSTKGNLIEEPAYQAPISQEKRLHSSRKRIFLDSNAIGTVMETRDSSWWLLLADALAGTVLGAFFGVYCDLTALLIMKYYNPHHLAITRGAYDMGEALVSMILSAPIGAVTGILVNGTKFDVSRKCPLRRLRFLLVFIGPALALPVIGNLMSIRTGGWGASFWSIILLPLWAVILSRLMCARKS